MQDLARRLYAWRGRELMGASDVLIWSTSAGIVVAFWGDALRMKLCALSSEVPNERGSTDLDLQRALGFAAKTRDSAGRRYPAEQFFPDGSIDAADLLTGVEVASSRFLGIEEGLSATFMPAQGSPWHPTASATIYYSAKTGRLSKTERPPWLIDVQYRDTKGEVKAPGADFCELMPIVQNCSMGAVVGTFSRPPELHFCVTHTLTIGEQFDMDAAKAVAKCGGMLFPSIAVGVVPATNFGELVLVADLGVILSSLRPYKRGRGAWPIVVYETDVWTATTHTFLGQGAHELFQELTGDPSLNWIYHRDFWVLGPPLMDDAARIVGSVSKLHAVIKKRARLYRRDLDAAGLEQARARSYDRPEWYAYAEAKSNGIVSMGCFPVAICPKKLRARADRWLSAAGFRGDLITISMDVPSYVPSGGIDGRDPRWDYAWRAMDALSAYARQHGKFALLQEK